MDNDKIQLSLSRCQIATIIVALSEYLYMVEEGSLDEFVEEHDLSDDLELLDASEIAEFLGELEIANGEH